MKSKSTSLVKKKKGNSTFTRVTPNIGSWAILLILLLTLNLLVTPVLAKPLQTNIIKYSLEQTVQIDNTLSETLKASDESHETIYSLSLKTTQLGTSDGKSEIVTSDSRVIAMRRFLVDYNSPMYPYAEVFIQEADKYGLDWRIVASISGVESAFGNLIPYRSNNAWGWKGDPTRDWSYFISWSEGIETVTKGLAQGYGTDLGPFDIVYTYCPPCGQTPGLPWAQGVTNYMNELSVYLNTL
ncbi:glucosaminidase domain-containing protein, partial [Candidatus Dojkabacteria bacterium]|nr:glucosaminidase domain-containing protein [Candidatus Dojkabacteria bacterium]MCB9790589.1 glucosaminidase domain-containing protein [Candidatus Nomurabacteria bacterium]